jgi:hypothetical protein
MITRMGNNDQCWCSGFSHGVIRFSAFWEGDLEGRNEGSLSCRKLDSCLNCLKLKP